MVNETMLYAGRLPALRDVALGEALSELPEIAISGVNARAIVSWAMATGTAGADILSEQPFPSEFAPELIGTAVACHYMSRMVTILGPRRLYRGPAVLRSLAKRVAACRFGAASDVLTPGDSLRFVAHRRLPIDMAWACPNSTVMDAFAGLTAAFDLDLDEAIRPTTREAVEEYLAGWRGQSLMSDYDCDWLEEFVEDMIPWDADTARLAVLAAVAPDQVNRDTIANYRSHYYPHEPAARYLLVLLSWSSLQAARRIGAWSKPRAARRSSQPSAMLAVTDASSYESGSASLAP
jgi:hypothetical protein